MVRTLLLLLSAACAGDPPPPPAYTTTAVRAPRPEVLAAGSRTIRARCPAPEEDP